MARKPLEEVTEDEFLADLVRTRCPRSILHPPARPDAFRPRSHAAVSIFQRRPALPAIRAENHAPPTPVQISFLQAKGQFKLAPEGCGAYPPDLPEMPIARIFPPRARARSRAGVYVYRYRGIYIRIQCTTAVRSSVILAYCELLICS